MQTKRAAAIESLTGGKVLLTLDETKKRDEKKERAGKLLLVVASGDGVRFTTLFGVVVTTRD